MHLAKMGQMWSAPDSIGQCSPYHACVSCCLPDCDKLRKDGFRSSQYYSQGPTFSGSNVSDDSLQEDEDMDKKVGLDVKLTRSMLLA